MHARYSPHPLLEPYLKEVWVSSRDFRGPYGALELLPDRYIELVFNFGAPCGTDEGRELPNAYILGLLDRPFRLQAEGVVHTVAARFYAWGFSPLMGFVVGEPERAVEGLEQAVQEGREGLEPLVGQGDLPAAAQRLHGFLLERALRLAARVQAG